jgi:hypothetical protein
MMRTRHEVFWDMSNKSFFGFEGSFAVVGESDAVSYAKYMCVDCHSWLIETDGSDDIGSFATNAR